jgi:carbamoyltransferase
MGTDMDYLVINNFIMKKSDQPDYTNKDRWIRKFKSD